jgi:hypothetical protein
MAMSLGIVHRHNFGQKRRFGECDLTCPKVVLKSRQSKYHFEFKSRRWIMSNTFTLQLINLYGFYVRRKFSKLICEDKILRTL